MKLNWKAVVIRLAMIVTGLVWAVIVGQRTLSHLMEALAMTTGLMIVSLPLGWALYKYSNSKFDLVYMLLPVVTNVLALSFLVGVADWTTIYWISTSSPCAVLIGYVDNRLITGIKAREAREIAKIDARHKAMREQLEASFKHPGQTPENWEWLN